MRHTFLPGAVFAALMLLVATPGISRAQGEPLDTLSQSRIRPLVAVVVTAERPSGFSAAMTRFGLRAGIATRERENRRLARELDRYDRVAFGLERKLDSLMITATIHELNIARTDSATAMLRSRRARLEAVLCETAPAECAGGQTLAGGTKAD